jgi:hypothetical protein
MLLQGKLDALKAEALAKTPPKVTLVRQRAVEGLAASGLAERAMHAGEQAPAFQLRNGYGGVFSSREALRRRGSTVPMIKIQSSADSCCGRASAPSARQATKIENLDRNAPHFPV